MHVSAFSQAISHLVSAAAPGTAGNVWTETVFASAALLTSTESPFTSISFEISRQHPGFGTHAWHESVSVVDADAKGLKEPEGQFVHVASSVADPAFDVYVPDGQGVCGMQISDVDTDWAATTPHALAEEPGLKVPVAHAVHSGFCSAVLLSGGCVGDVDSPGPHTGFGVQLVEACSG